MLKGFTHLKVVELIVVFILMMYTTFQMIMKASTSRMLDDAVSTKLGFHQPRIKLCNECSKMQ